MIETQPFLLHPDHRSFLDGTARQLNTAERVYFAHLYYRGPPTVLAVVLGIAALAYQFSGNAAQPNWFCLPYILLPLLALYLLWWYRARKQWHQLRYLEQEGQVLNGYISAECIKGIPLPKDCVQLWMEYTFHTPDGRALRGQTVGAIAQDVPLPRPGTPVKVLYMNDDFYRLL